jgi:hypothetical protein
MLRPFFAGTRDILPLPEMRSNASERGGQTVLVLP